MNEEEKLITFLEKNKNRSNIIGKR